MPRIHPSILQIFKKPLWLLAFCFISMVIFSVVGLDLINRQKGEKVYIFSARKAKPDPATLPARKLPTKEERAEVMPAEKEEEIEKESMPGILTPEKIPVKSEPIPAEAPPSPEASADLKRRKGKVAIIVDDMGFSLQTIEDLGSINLPLTIAILPHSPWAVETAHIARNNGLEVILHLPMESLNDFESNKDTAGLIHSGMSNVEILRILEDNLGRVPFIQGVNNHMGSKITAERELMLPILERLKEKNLYFVDSVTSGRSIAYQLARQIRIPAAERHVFLDTDPQEESIKQSLFQLFRLAKRRGMAVGICHPLEATVRVLLENLQTIDSFDCEAVCVSKVLR